MFIDPVVDVFVDPCEPSYRQPTTREKEKFQHWTQRYYTDSHFTVFTRRPQKVTEHGAQFFDFVEYFIQ